MTEAEVQRLMGLVDAWAAAEDAVRGPRSEQVAIDARAALESALREALQPAGWRLVPVEPTPEMVYRGGEAADCVDWDDAGEDEPYRLATKLYRAMLAAAPSTTTAPAAPEVPTRVTMKITGPCEAVWEAERRLLDQLRGWLIVRETTRGDIGIQEIEAVLTGQADRPFTAYVDYPAQEVPADARDATGRSPTDYALEFAEYLARGAERLLEAINDLAAAELHREEADDDEDEDAVTVEAARDGVSAHCQDVRNGIYEFRKRRDRAAMAAPTPQEQKHD